MDPLRARRDQRMGKDLIHCSRATLDLFTLLHLVLLGILSCLLHQIQLAAGDESKGSVAHVVADSLMDLERLTHGPCQVLISRLLQRLGSSKESSTKALQELTTRIFIKSIPESTNSKVVNRKKEPNTETSENTSFSPLAQFLLTRWQGQVARDPNSM